MYILIVGGNVFGYHLGRALVAIGHEVLILEPDPAQASRIEEELGGVALQGDGSDPSVLKRAGASRADVIVAVTGSDETNLAACQAARHLYSIARTIAVVNNPQNEPLFRLLGVDVTVSATGVILSHLEEELPARPLIHLLSFHEAKARLVSVTIPADADVVKQRVSAIKLPPSTFICLVVKKGAPVFPAPDVVLDSDDQVLAVTTTEEEEGLWEALTRVKLA